MAISNFAASSAAAVSSTTSILLAKLGITSASNSHQFQETGAITSERNQLTTAQQQHVQDMLASGQGLFSAAAPAGDKQTTRLQQREESARARHARHAEADENRKERAGNARYERAKKECEKKQGVKCAKKMLRAAKEPGPKNGEAKKYLQAHAGSLLAAADKSPKHQEKRELIKMEIQRLQTSPTPPPIGPRTAFGVTTAPSFIAPATTAAPQPVSTAAPATTTVAEQPTTAIQQATTGPNPLPTTANAVLKFEPTPAPKAESELTVKPIKTKKPAPTPGPDEDTDIDLYNGGFRKLTSCVKANFGSNKNGENTCRLTNHCKKPVKIEIETGDKKEVMRLKVGSSAPCFKTGETTTTDRQGNKHKKNLFENIRSSKVKVSKDDDG